MTFHVASKAAHNTAMQPETVEQKRMIAVSLIAVIAFDGMTNMHTTLCCTVLVYTRTIMLLPCRAQSAAEGQANKSLAGHGVKKLLKSTDANPAEMGTLAGHTQATPSVTST